MPKAVSGLLTETMQYLLDHPEDHDPKAYFDCGTPSCFAGHAIFLAGKYQSYLTSGWATLNYARCLLGISYDDARLLFHDTNSLEKLGLLVKDLENGEELHHKWEIGYSRGGNPLGQVQPRVTVNEDIAEKDEKDS